MNKEEQLNSDKKVLASLEAEYKRAQRVIYSIRALVTDLNFEELIPDSQERCLMVDELQAYDYIRTNLMNRIRFYRTRVKANNPEPWEKDEAARTVETLCGPVRLVDTDKAPKEQLDDILKNGMPDIQVERDPSFDDVSFQAKKLIDDFYATHDRAARLGIAEQILLVMFGQTPDELNGIMEKEARNINSVISAIQHGNEEATHHCGQDATCQVGDGSAAVNEIPDSIKSLEGMQVIKVCGPKCKDCPCGDGLREYPSWLDASSCVKVELVGGTYLCLAPLHIVTE